MDGVFIKLDLVILPACGSVLRNQRNKEIEDRALKWELVQMQATLPVNTPINTHFLDSAVAKLVLKTLVNDLVIMLIASQSNVKCCS